MSEFNLRELADRIASLRVSGSGNGAIIGCSGYHETTDEYEFYKIATTGDHVTAKDIADALVVFPKLVEGNTSLLARAEKAEAYAIRLPSDETRVWKCEKCGYEFSACIKGEWQVGIDNPSLPCGNCETGRARPLAFLLRERVADLESSLAALKEATRWRKVEEELPENGKTVWVLDRNGFIYTYNYYTGLSLSPMYTHWRPIDLPETDKEGME